MKTEDAVTGQEPVNFFPECLEEEKAKAKALAILEGASALKRICFSRPLDHSRESIRRGGIVRLRAEARQDSRSQSTAPPGPQSA